MSNRAGVISASTRPNISRPRATAQRCARFCRNAIGCIPPRQSIPHAAPRRPAPSPNPTVHSVYPGAQAPQNAGLFRVSKLTPKLDAFCGTRVGVARATLGLARGHLPSGWVKGGRGDWAALGAPGPAVCQGARTGGVTLRFEGRGEGRGRRAPEWAIVTSPFEERGRWAREREPSPRSNARTRSPGASKREAGERGRLRQGPKLGLRTVGQDQAASAFSSSFSDFAPRCFHHSMTIGMTERMTMPTTMSSKCFFTTGT